MSKISLAILAALLLAIIASPLAVAMPLYDTYTSQPDGTNGIDTDIEQDGANTNYGTQNRLKIQGGGYWR